MSSEHDLEPERRLDIVEGVTFNCPFCKAAVTAGETKCGKPAVRHAFPTCSKFNVLGPLEYMQEVNKHFAAREPN